MYLLGYWLLCLPILVLAFGLYFAFRELERDDLKR